ncbi:helix-turn-helix domain-containing protein [Agromyces cerinus]|uniref:helix-turn-helix domain-containing protein n=1 Tax=Agromyces cerinus TaxID=33878 RepID=UPI002285E254|nr:helix-turn-helix domain-containing protein [Agromyces cerinus]
MNVAAVAEHLGVHPQTVYAHAASGQIPGFRVGRAWRFYLSKVDATLHESSDPWALPSRRR